MKTRWVLAAAVAGLACSPKVVAYRNAMKSDLHNLLTAEESYFQDHRRYAADVGALEYGTSVGVTVQVDSADEQGFRAHARHAQLTITCRIAAGIGAPAEKRAIDCDPLDDPYHVKSTERLAATSWLIVVASAFFVGRRVMRRRNAWWWILPQALMVILHPAWTVVPATAAGSAGYGDCWSQASSVCFLFAIAATLVALGAWQRPLPLPTA